MSNDGRFVAAGGADGNLFVWDLGGGSGGSGGPGMGMGGSASGAAQLTVLKHHKDAVVATAWAVDGAVLVSADKTGALAFWSLTGL